MTAFLSLLALYFAFLLETGITRYPPDLVLLVLLIFALNETKKMVLGLSLFAGFCLDLVNPMTFGFNLLLCLLIGYGISALKEKIYYGKRHLVILLIIVLSVKYALGFLFFRSIPPLLEIIISGFVTLALILPGEWVLERIFAKLWKVA